MAESYRGLTIQIGGDTTKLTKALHTANQAVSSTQSGLKKLSDALKLDPTSFEASQLQVGAFAEQAANAAARLTTLNDAMHQVGSQIRSFDGAPATVRELADSWGNVTLKASQTRDYFSALTNTLASSYTELSKLHSEAAKVAGQNASDKLLEDLSKVDFSAAISSVQDLRSAFGDNNGRLKETLSNLKSLQKEYQALAEKEQECKDIMAREEGNTEWVEANINNVTAYLPKLSEASVQASIELQETATRMDEVRVKYIDIVKELEKYKGKGQFFKFDNKNVDLASLATALKSIVDAGKMSVEQADEMYDSFERMKSMWQDAFENVKTANAVEGFHDLEAETAKATAKVKSLVDEMVRLSNTSDVAKGMVALKQEFKEITDSGAVAQQRLKGILEILSQEGNENNTFLQREAMREYAEVTAKAGEAVDNITEQLDHYDGTIRKLAASTESYSAETTAANKNFEEAAAALKGYEGAMAELQTMQDAIKAANPDDYMDNEGYKGLQQTLEAMEKVVEQLRSQFASADAEKKKFVEIGEVRELTDKLANANAEVKKWSNINVKVNVDTSALDGIKGLSEAISKGIDLSGLHKFREEIDKTATTLSAAEQRYKQLSDAVKIDPTNTETVRQRTAAFDQVVEATTKHIEAMKAELAAIPADRIDSASLAAGTAQQKLQEAKQQIENYKTAIVDINKRIDDLTKEKKEIKLVDDDAIAKADKLGKSIDELKARRAALAAAGDAAFDTYIVAAHTAQVEKDTVAIQQGEAALHKYAIEREKAGQIEMPTPKIDEAAFMQVVDRVSQGVRQMAQEVVQSANEIDSAFRNVTKTVNGTDEQLAKLKETAVSFSQTNVTSADTMLEMQALGGQLGILVEDLEQFGKIGSNLDIATDMDAEDIALKLGQISNVLHLDIDGIQGFADALVRLGNNMPAQESAIMAVAQRFGAIAATANFSGDEILAWSAAIAATGQRSEAAATAISNTVSGIEQAVANGGNTLKQFAIIANMSADEFKNAWQTSPTETLKAFIEGLKNLKDSDESAIAALENMGITGVRQQQTLMNLTQTVEKLDDALAMSGNAWHGVTDQWGQSGDAAVEAEKKSQGFSGALAIMQNNAQNLAASLGDGLIPFMKAAAKVMEFVTDVLNNMPTPVKELVVALGGTSVMFSTLTPVLTLFGKGLGNTIAMFKDTSNIVDFIAKLTGVESAMQAAAEGGVNLISVLGGIAPAAIAISAVAVAIGVAVSAVNEYTEKQELFRQATDGMTEAVRNARIAYDEYSPSISGAITSLEDMTARTSEVIESQAALADSMSAEWSGVGENAALVDYLAQKIVELSEQSELTKAQQSELNAAIESFNDLTGAGIEILDRNTGKLSESGDAIYRVAEAYKQAAIAQAAYEMYGDVIKQRLEAQMAYDEAAAGHKKVLEELDKAENGYTDGVYKNEAAIARLRLEEQGWAKEMEDNQRIIDSADESLDQLFGYMGQGDQAASKMREALVDAGYSVEEFDQLTREEMLQVAATFDGSADSIIEGMKRIREAKNLLAGETSDALDEASKAAARARAELYKTGATETYNARKAELDKEYNDAKRSYDAQYNALKKSLDAEYDEKKRQLDRQYDLRKRALDKEYDAQKQAYDKQYDALKRSLDRQYDAQKLKLDHELDAIKKSNDAKLQALKRRFDNEEDAYKDATEHQVKELERKHKLEIRAIEDERDAKVNAIDEEIRALEALNDAEQHEVDKTKQDNKIADLQKKVNDAKSRRKKAEAEKELNEYIQEVEVKRRKWERDAQIEDLKLKKETIKEEADARKDAANDAYDIEKENFKNSREEQLELLKQANDDRYNAMKLALEAEEQAKKEANDLALENIKYNHQDQLQELKDHNDAQLAALKEKNELELQSIKNNNDMILQSMKDAHSAQLDEMKNNQSIALENMKAAQTKELQDLKASQDAMYKAIKDGGSTMAEATREKYEIMKNHFSDKVTEMLSFGRKSFSELPKVAQTEGDNTEKRLTEKLTTLKTNASRLFNDTSNAAHTELGRMVPDSNWVANGVKDSLIEGIREAAIGVGTEARQLTQDAKTEFDNMPTDAEKSAEGVGSSIEGGINRSAPLAVNEVVRVASDIAGNFNFDRLGSDAGNGMISNFNSSMVTRWYDTLLPNIRNMAQTIMNYLGHSVPKKGPLSTDDEWGGHFVENIVDGMHSKEKELYRQVERMADAIEEGFDPTLSVDAAFEALDTIGKNRGKSLEVLADSKSAPNITVNLNMNLSGVSIREDADIERLAKAMSQEMAAQAARQIAGRLG